MTDELGHQLPNLRNSGSAPRETVQMVKHSFP